MSPTTGAGSLSLAWDYQLVGHRPSITYCSSTALLSLEAAGFQPSKVPSKGSGDSNPAEGAGCATRLRAAFLLLKKAVTFRRRTALFAFRGRGRPAGAPGRRRAGVLSFPELGANSARTVQEVAVLLLRRAALTVARAPAAPSLADRVPATARKQEARPRPGHLLAWGAKRNPEGEARTEPRVEALPGAVISDDPALVPLRPAATISTSTSLSRLQVPKDSRGGTCLYRRVSPKPRVQIELTLLGARAACRCVGEESSSAAQATQAHGAHGAVRGHEGRAN